MKGKAVLPGQGGACLSSYSGMDSIGDDLGFYRSPDFGKLRFCNLPKSGDQTKPKPLSPYGSYRQPLGPAMLSTLADLAHALGARAFHLLDGVAEVIHALEILVHRCEA